MKIFSFLASFRPTNIHELNRLIENGYRVWGKVYKFFSEQQEAAQGAANKVAEEIADILNTGQPSAPPAAGVHVEA